MYVPDVDGRVLQAAGSGLRSVSRSPVSVPSRFSMLLVLTGVDCGTSVKKADAPCKSVSSCTSVAGQYRLG